MLVGDDIPVASPPGTPQPPKPIFNGNKRLIEMLSKKLEPVLIRCKEHLRHKCATAGGFGYFPSTVVGLLFFPPYECFDQRRGYIKDIIQVMEICLKHTSGTYPQRIQKEFERKSTLTQYGPGPHSSSNGKPSTVNQNPRMQLKELREAAMAAKTAQANSATHNSASRSSSITSSSSSSLPSSFSPTAYKKGLFNADSILIRLNALSKGHSIDVDEEEEKEIAEAHLRHMDAKERSQYNSILTRTNFNTLVPEIALQVQQRINKKFNQGKEIWEIILKQTATQAGEKELLEMLSEECKDKTGQYDEMYRSLVRTLVFLAHSITQ